MIVIQKALRAPLKDFDTAKREYNQYFVPEVNAAGGGLNEDKSYSWVDFQSRGNADATIEERFIREMSVDSAGNRTYQLIACMVFPGSKAYEDGCLIYFD